MIFTRLARAKGTASTMALAVAVATGAVMGMAALESPAVAAKPEKAAKPSYSKAFIEAYKPMQVLLNAPAPDAAAIKAALPTIEAAIQNDDDKFAVGQTYVAASQKTNDLKLALTGLELMLASGKTPATSAGLYNFQAGQIAYKYEDYPKARTYLQAAIDAGYTDNNPETFIAESYFAEDKVSEGIAYLTKVIDARRAAGKPIEESWVKRGLAMAYNTQMKPEAQQYAALYVTEFPGEASWKDAIAINLNVGGYENPEILDLLRLGRRVGTLAEGRTYMEYVDAADYRRLPAEVVSVINEAYAKDLIPKSDPYISDTLAQATTRAKADQADMAGLMKDARAPNAAVRTVMAAGDALLSLNRPSEAEEFFAKATTMPGPEVQVAMTRLGIAQFDQGKYPEAEATFAKVTGDRAAIANLWTIYTREKAANTM